MKPSEINNIRAKKTWCLLPSFDAIMWKGIAYCKKNEKMDNINKTDEIDSNLKSHELIHVRQAYSMKDSWFRFYANYVWEYIKNLPLIFTNIKAPYFMIHTEIEAYANANNWKYAAANKPLEEWKKYKKLTLSEKRTLAKEFFATKDLKKYASNVKKLIKTKI